MLLELSVGIWSSFFVSYYFGEELTLTFIFFGMIFAKLMDVDFLIYLFKNNRKIDQFAHEHRDILHYPIFYSLGGYAVFVYILQPNLALLWLFASLGHFVCDTFFGGWGIKWLVPFCNWYFCLASYSPQKIIKTKEGQRQIAKEYGDPNWIKNNSKLSFSLLRDLIIFLISSIFAFFAIS
jgi:hypothetical protein